MSDFKFSLYYLAITGTGSMLISGHGMAAGYTTLAVAVAGLALCLSGGYRHG